MKMYDRGGSFTKKKVAVVVCKNPKASRRDIEEQLLDSDYNEITQYQDELQIAESVQGDKIQNLNNRIKALKDKISATKSSEQKSKFQNTLKNALQSLSNIRKAQTESVNEAASVEAMGIAALTGLRGDAVQKFIDDNNIHARKLFAFLKMKGPHTLSNRMDISTAIVGKANNKYAQGIIKAFSESKINEANDTYFNSFTDAVSYARKVAEKKGFEIDENDWQSQIALGGKYSRSRPGVGKTNTFTVGLLKGGKPQRKALQISVYGMESGKFELTHYIN
jgi:Asp-tRNA(Asn)/Glu-tRNA(Gln) amidotransferase C subunit